MPVEVPTVYVIDDDPAIRESVAGLLESAGLSAICFATAEDFLRISRTEGPGCIVLDINLPGINGLQFQQALRNAGVRIPIIFLTGHGDIPMTVSAMKYGAVEFFTKPTDDQQLLQAIGQALSRDRRSRELQAERAVFRQRYDRLTARERQVMGLVLSGLQNKQIAAQLGTSIITIKVHRSQIMHKMEAGSLLELARIAERLDSAAMAGPAHHAHSAG